MTDQPEKAELSLALMNMLAERDANLTETAISLQRAMRAGDRNISNICRSPKLASTALVVAKRALERNVLRDRAELNELLEAASQLALGIALSERELAMIKQEEALIARDKQTYKEDGLYRGAVNFITRLHANHGIWHVMLDALSDQQVADIAAIICEPARERPAT